MDKSLANMKYLVFRLSSRCFQMDLSTFSKASRFRDPSVFENLLQQVTEYLKKQKGTKKVRSLFPLDSTVITLTSK